MKSSKDISTTFFMDLSFILIAAFIILLSNALTRSLEKQTEEFHEEVGKALKRMEIDVTAYKKVEEKLGLEGETFYFYVKSGGKIYYQRARMETEQAIFPEESAILSLFDRIQSPIYAVLAIDKDVKYQSVAPLRLALQAARKKHKDLKILEIMREKAKGETEG